MNRSFLLRVALVLSCLSFATQPAYAAVVTYGNVDLWYGWDPKTGISQGYVGGQGGAGTLTVDGDSNLSTFSVDVGSGVAGFASVTVPEQTGPTRTCSTLAGMGVSGR